MKQFRIKATAQVEKEIIINAESEEEAKLLFDEHVIICGISFNEITKNSMKAVCFPVDNGFVAGSYINLTNKNNCSLN